MLITMSTVRSESVRKDVKFLKISNANFLPTVELPSEDKTKQDSIVLKDSISGDDLKDRDYNEGHQKRAYIEKIQDQDNDNKHENRDHEDKVHGRDYDDEIQKQDNGDKLRDKDCDDKLQDNGDKLRDKDYDDKLQKQDYRDTVQEKDYDIKFHESDESERRGSSNGRVSQTSANQLDRTKHEEANARVTNTPKQSERSFKSDGISTGESRQRHIVSKPAGYCEECDNPQDYSIHKSSMPFCDLDNQDFQRIRSRQSEKSNLSVKSFESPSWVESECQTPSSSRMSCFSDVSNRATSSTTSSASFYPETGYPETWHVLKPNYPPMGYPSSGLPKQVYPPTTFPATGVYPGVSDDNSVLFTESLLPSCYGEGMTRSVSWNSYSRSGSKVSANLQGVSPYPQ